MQMVDLTKPGEKKKLVWAAVLGIVAIGFLYWTLIGFDSGKPANNQARATATPAQQQRPGAQTAAGNTNGMPSNEVTSLAWLIPINYERSLYSPPAARRNIFAYYEPPPPPAPSVSTPTPTPAPPPTVLLASVSPSNVYARTGDFLLEVAGDRFTPAVRIFIDGRELPTSYKNPQQLSTTVPASFIAAAGTRQVVVQSPDKQLWSQPMVINVAAPPTPNFTYVGIIGRPNRVYDVALVMEKNNKNIISALRGDVLGGRFRVTSISEKELVLTDTTLKIKHTIAMSEPDKGTGPLSRPTPRVDAEDDEP